MSSESFCSEYLKTLLFTFFIKNVGKYEVIFPLRFNINKVIIMTITRPIITPNIAPTTVPLLDFDGELDISFVVSKLKYFQSIRF